MLNNRHEKKVRIIKQELNIVQKRYHYNRTGESR